MLLEDCYEKIQSMSAVSSTISHYLAAQFYRFDYEIEDEIDINDLMIKCYVIIIGELKELGINLTVDWDLALANGYESDGYVALYSLLDKDYLHKFFITYPDVQDSIRYIFETSDTSNSEEEDENNYIDEFIDIYTRFNSNDPLLEKVERIRDRIISTNRFKDHILTILDNSVPTSDISIDNFELISKYTKHIFEGQQLFKNVVEYILIKDTTLNSGKLQQAIELYDLEKVTGLDIANYAWAVMSNDEDLSDKEKSIKKSILDKHTKHQSHHIEYYLANLIRPTKENLVELVSHHVELDSTKESFFNDVKDMVVQASESQIFTKQDIEYIKKLISFIVPKYYATGKLVVNNQEENKE